MTTSVPEVKLVRLAVELRPPVARVMLRHAPLNVIDVPMMDELLHTVSDIAARPDISIVVLSGEGKGFSAGVDVAAHTPDKVKEMLFRFHSLIRAWVVTEKVTIASVHGSCLGGGAELAMVCDIVFTASSARWGFPEIRLGCYPPVACSALPALVGPKRAAELVLTGRSITGTAAEEMGLANHSVCDDELMPAVDQMVNELSRLSPSALAATKKAIYSWDAIHFDKGLARAEKLYLEELLQTADAQEGIRAFMEKRPPRWTGR